MNNRKREPGIRPIGIDRWKVTARIRINGKIRQKQSTFKGTKEQAKELHALLKKELREGKSEPSPFLPSTIQKFGDLLKIHLDKHDQCSTTYKAKIRHVEDELGEIDIRFFPDRFENYLHHLRATKSPCTHKMRSNATINRVIEIVRAAYNTGVALGFIEINPITKIRFPRLKELPRDVVLSELDRQNLLNVIDKEAPHLSAVVRFALQVPCRRSELVKMRKEDLDLIHNAIRVKAENSKNDKGCWKPIPPDMVDYFRNLPKETDYLFYRKTDDKSLGITTYAWLGDFHGTWRRCLKLAKLENFRFHDTRHCSASALVNNGTPEQVVMDVANWKTNMLRKYYHREPIQSLKLVRFSPLFTTPLEPSVSFVVNS